MNDDINWNKKFPEIFVMGDNVMEYNVMNTYVNFIFATDNIKFKGIKLDNNLEIVERDTSTDILFEKGEYTDYISFDNEELIIDFTSMDDYFKQESLIKNIVNELEGNNDNFDISVYNIKLNIEYITEDSNFLEKFKNEHTFNQLDMFYEGKTIYAMYQGMPVIIDVYPHFRDTNKFSVQLQTRLDKTQDIAKVLKELNKFIDKILGEAMADIMQREGVE